jgi:hypothetical protein
MVIRQFLFSITGVVFLYSTCEAQNAVVSTLHLPSAGHHHVLQPAPLTTDHILTMPTASGTLLLSNEQWLTGGQTLLPGPLKEFGTTDAVPVTILANGADCINVGASGSTAGHVGVGTPATDVMLAIAGGLSVQPPAVHDVDVDGVAITVGNRSFIEIANPPSGLYAANVFVTLSNGLTDGQILVLTGNQTSVRLQATDMNLSLLNGTNRVLGGNAGDAPRGTIVLIWYGGVWREIARRNNTVP